MKYKLKELKKTTDPKLYLEISTLLS